MASVKRPSDKDFVYCIHCEHAIFKQWFNNPIIAQCKIRRERFVAEAHRTCRLYSPSHTEKVEIEHFDSYDQ